MHDVGKPPVRHVKPNGDWGFFQHETAGASLSHEVLTRLRVGRQLERAVTHLVRRHMDRPDLESRKSIRRFVARAGEQWPDLLALKRADNASHTYDDNAYHDQLEATCLDIEARDAELLRRESPLTGDDLVAIAGRPPGPWIRPIKDALGDLVLEGAIAPGDKVSAEERARAWLSGAEPIPSAPAPEISDEDQR
jgi:poly(A) polymerase